MSNDLFNFHYQDDQQEKDNNYSISDCQWIYINDIKQSRYYWSAAYFAIPYTVTVVPDGTILTTVVDAGNANALSIKSNACLVDWCPVKFDGVSVTRNSYFNHLMMGERIKQYSADKFKLYGDILNHVFDSGNTIGYNATAGEYKSRLHSA
jgi:hypothetical protein